MGFNENFFTRLLSKYGEHVCSAAFILVLFFWVKGGHNFDQLWMQRWAILLIGTTAVLAISVGKHTSWLLAPSVFFSILPGLVTSFWFTRYDDAMMEKIAFGISNPVWFDSESKWTMQAVLRQDASRGIFALLALVFLIRVVSVGWATRIRTMLGLCGLVQAIIILANYKTASQWIFYSGNPSMGGAFVALSLWILDSDIHRHLRGWCTVLARALVWGTGIAAVLATQATTPLLGLAGGMGAFVLAQALGRGTQSKGLLKLAGALAVAVAGLLTVAYSLQGSELWNDTYRFRMWSWMLEFWDRQNLFTRLFGFGTGTMRTLLPLAQVEHGESKFWLFYLHNDWLTWIPELGLAGTVANLVASLELFRRSLRWPHFSAMLGCFGAVMITGFPLHWPVFVLAFAMIVRPLVDQKHLYPYYWQIFQYDETKFTKGPK